MAITINGADMTATVEASVEARILANDGKYTKAEVDALIVDAQPVGSVVLRMDVIDPATIYGGTWSLITGDASLSFGDGTVMDGVASGTNTPAVPLLEHTHTFTGAAMADHTHGFTGWAVTSSSMGGSGSGRGPLAMVTDPAPSGTPAGTNSNAGTPGATLDVRGARISINVWQRTA